MDKNACHFLPRIYPNPAGLKIYQTKWFLSPFPSVSKPHCRHLKKNTHTPFEKT